MYSTQIFDEKALRALSGHSSGGTSSKHACRHDPEDGTPVPSGIAHAHGAEGGGSSGGGDGVISFSRTSSTSVSMSSQATVVANRAFTGSR